MGARPTRTAKELGPLRIVFRLILGFWIFSPLLLTATASQDGPAFLAAARLAPNDPTAVFANRFGPNDRRIAPPEQVEKYRRWVDAYCGADPSGACEANHAGFLSPPPSLLVYLPLTLASGTLALLLVRVLSAVFLAAGMEVIWRVMTPRTERDERLLLFTAILATPIAINVVTLGQNTGVLFLSAALGVDGARRLSRRARATAVDRTGAPRRADQTQAPASTQAGAPGSAAGAPARAEVQAQTQGQARLATVGRAVLLALAVMLKLFPALLFVPLAAQRRWRFIGWTLGVLVTWSLLTALVLPTTLWTELASALGSYRDEAMDPYNRGFDAILHATVLPNLQRGTITTASLLGRVATVIAMWFVRVRHLDDDVQWAFVWLAAILLSDFVWPHYFLLLLPMAAFIIRRRPDLDWLLPGAAAVTLVLLATWPVFGAGHVLALAAMLGGVVVLPFLATPVDPDLPTPDRRSRMINASPDPLGPHPAT